MHSYILRKHKTRFEVEIPLNLCNITSVSSKPGSSVSIVSGYELDDRENKV
jgi:hypothetical protein